MSSSTELRVLRGLSSDDATELRMPELRHGTWTRLGDGAVRGDDATELLLDRLAGATREAARAQGYAVGWAEGRHAAVAAAQAEAEQAASEAAAHEERRRVEHAAAVAALRAAAEHLHGELGRVCRAVDEQASGLALELTRELVGSAVPDAEHVLARVLGLLPDHPVVRVRLHPEVAADAGELRGHGVSVVADPQLGRGDAVVEADDHVVDLRTAEALTRLREVLR